MSNTYLIETSDKLQLDLEIKKIIKNNNFNTNTINIYDLEITSLENALIDLDTFSFLEPQKIIIIKNLDKISKSSLDYNLDDCLEHLYKYIENPNIDNLLFITIDKINLKLNTFKKLKKITNYIKVETNIENYIKNELKNYKLENNFIKFLIEYSNNNLSKIENEIKKLKNYKSEDEILNIQDIKDLVIKEYSDSKDLTFSLINNIGKKDIKQSILDYQELIKYGVNDIGLITMISNQFILLLQIKQLIKKKYNNKQIGEHLNITNDYRVKKLKELTIYYEEEELLKIIKKIHEVDIQMKTTDQNTNNLIIDFLLTIKK